jgi:hypothetical protein
MILRYIKIITKGGKCMTEKVRNITIRISYDIWKRLRRMQEDDKIKSIQQACIEGLKHVIEERGD